LPVDNDHDNVVVVYLVDLGRLPFTEQQHWRTYNIPPAGTISETAFRRDFLAEFADSRNVEHRFQAAYDRLNEAWDRRFGWHLYLPPTAEDAHVKPGLHIPTNDSMVAFEHEIMPFAKATVDFLNEAKLAEPLANKPNGGITTLEEFLNGEDLPLTLPPVLRQIQGARSKTAAHRKSNSFDINKLLDGAVGLPDRFAKLLTEVAAAFDELADAL
jgi:hypothetical protein